jgi:hypothetical protein
MMLGALAGEANDEAEAIRRYRAVLAIDGSNVMALNNSPKRMPHPTRM